MGKRSQDSRGFTGFGAPSLKDNARASPLVSSPKCLPSHKYVTLGFYQVLQISSIPGKSELLSANRREWAKMFIAITVRKNFLSLTECGCTKRFRI